MAVTLQLQAVAADGSTGICDLQDGTATITLAYTPLTPTTTTAAFDPGPLGDGGENLGMGYRNVVEPVRVLIKGADVTAIRTRLRAIETALQQARRYSQKKLYPRVYVLFVPESTGAGGVVLRSELLDGQLTIGQTGVDSWSRLNVEVMLSWTRRYYWEANADVQMPLSNGHGTNNTAGLVVDNAGDSGRSNYVIPAIAALGTLPAPLRLEFTNSTNTAYAINNLYVGSAAYTDGSTAYTALDLEGEAATGGSTLPVTPDTTVLSGGTYQQATYATDSNEHQLFEWTLSQSLLDATRGNYYRLMTRFANFPVGTEYVRFRLYFGGLTVLWEGPLTKLAVNAALADLGAIPLPPWLVGLNTLYPITLRMYGVSYPPAVGTQTISVDVIHLLPTFAWRRYVARGYGIPYTVRLVDDGINGYVYQDGWSAPGGRTGYYSAIGAPLLLDPSTAQQFFLSWDNTTGASVVASTATVKLFYRPRYLSV